MKLARRQFLNCAAGAAALLVIAAIAQAQSYPNRPVRLIAPFPPGGSIDITARLVGQRLTEHLGQQFVIENRPGAGGNIGSETALNSPADGYTLLLCSVANAISATLYDKLNYDFRDIAPVAAISRAPNVMVVNPSVPANSVPEFIAYAKANPGKINMASSGVGTSIHLSGELFKLMTGIDMQHVPYRGSAPMLTDLLAGQVQVAFDNLQPSLPHIKAGKLRALAVTTAARSEALPDLPPISDFVPGYEASTWNGVCAPRNTPSEIVNKLNAEINAGLADPNMKARLADVGASALPGSPADYAKLITDEIEKWAPDTLPVLSAHVGDAPVALEEFVRDLKHCEHEGTLGCPGDMPAARLAPDKLPGIDFGARSRPLLVHELALDHVGLLDLDMLMIGQSRPRRAAHEGGDQPRLRLKQQRLDLATGKAGLLPFHIGRAHNMGMPGGLGFTLCHGMHDGSSSISMRLSAAATLMN